MPKDSLFSLTKSRYKDQPMIIQPDGLEYYLRRERKTYEERDDDRFYIVKDGDAIDKIAYDMLGDERHWWVVADYNELRFPMDIETGQRLRIPSVEVFEMEILG